MLKQKFEFGEKRMVFLSNPEVPKGLSESADTRREEFLKLLESKKIVELDAADIVRDNPLLDEIKIPDFEVKVFAHRPGEIELSAVDRKALKDYIDGKYNVSDGSPAIERIEEASRENNVDEIDVGEVLKKGPKNLAIDGLGYAALVWPEIHGKLVNDLSDAGIDKDKIEAALRNYKSYPKLQELIIARAKALKGGGFVVGNLAVDAIKQIEVGAKLAALPAEKAADDAREKLRRDLNRSNSLKKFELSYSEDLPAITSKQLEGAGVGEWLNAKNMRENNVDPGKWDVSTPDGLAGMRYDLAESLHISINNSPWVGFFNELAKASDNNFLNNSGLNPDWFKEPVNYQALTSNGQESFVIAHKWFVALREQAMAISKSQQIYDEALQNKDKIPVLSTVVDEVKSNVGKLTDAIRTKDWATAAVYLAGIWGVYKIYKNNSDSGIGKFIKDSIPYLAVAGLGLMVAKNAGVDLLKMAGIRNAASAFDGTYIADLFDVKGIDLTKLDSEVLMDASQVKLGALWQAYKTPAAAGFVDPFSVDSTVYGRFGAMGGSLTDKRKTRDFDRTGKQLYELVGGVEKAYMATIFKDPKAPEYGISFDDLMKSEHGNSLLIDLMAKISKYTHRKLDVKGAAALNKRVSQIFDGHDLGPSAFVTTKLNIASSKPGEAGEEDEVLTGTVAGYPVVVIAKGDSYKIYDRAEFEARGLNAGALLTVPSEGEIDASVKGQVGKFGDVVKERAKALIEKSLPAGVTKNDLKWSGSSWEYEKTADSKFVAFGVSGDPVKVRISISTNGKVEHHETAGGGAELVKKIVELTSSSSLYVLQQSGAMKFVKFDDDDAVLEIAGEEIRFEAVGGAPAFKAGEMEKLVKSKKFKAKYLDVVRDDNKVEFKEKLERIYKRLESLDEESIEAIAKDVTGATTTDRRGLLDKLTDGAFSEDQVKELITLLKHQVVRNLAGRLEAEFTDLKSFDTAAGNYLSEMTTKLDDVLRRVEKRNPDDNISTNEFENDIFKPMLEAGSRSKSYAVEFRKSYDAFYKAKVGILKSPHDEVRAMMEKFVNYTAGIDEDPFDNKRQGYCDYVRRAIINDEAVKSFEEFETAIANGAVDVTPMIEANLRLRFDGYLESKLSELKGRYTLKTEAVEALKKRVMDVVKTEVLTSAVSKATRAEQMDLIEDRVNEEFVKHIDENTHGFYREAAGAEQVVDFAKSFGAQFGRLADWASDKAKDWGNNLPEEKLTYPTDEDRLSENMKTILGELSSIQQVKDTFVYTAYNGAILNASTLIPRLEYFANGWKESTEALEKDVLDVAWAQPDLVKNPGSNADYRQMVATLEKFSLQYAISKHLLQTFTECYGDLGSGSNRITDLDKLKSVAAYFRTKIIKD